MNDFDMDRICRLCCTVKSRMRPLFEHRQKYPFSLCQMIYATAQVEVNPNDQLPQKICKLCVTNLIKIFHTIDSYRENDLKLRQQLERTVLDQTDDGTGAVATCIQNEVTGSEQLEPEPMNYQQDEVTHAEDEDEGRSMELDMCIKEESGIAESRDYSTSPEHYNERRPTELCVRVKEDFGIHENQEAFARAEDHDKDRPVWQNMRIKNEPGTDEKRDADTSAEYDDRQISTGLNNNMINQSVNTPTEHELVVIPNIYLDAAVQKYKPEPIPKRPRGRPRTNVEGSRPKLNDYKCYICKSESHGTATALLTHLNSTHSGLLPFTCPECVMETIVLKNLLNLNVHMRRHLNPVKCLYCDKRYISKYKVDIHVKQQHPSMFDDSAQGSIKCTYCSKKFTCRVSMLQHVKRVHSASKTVSCATCGEKFIGKAKLRSHIKRNHITSVKKYECSLCQKSVTSLKILQGHMEKFHTSTSPVFKCSHCPMTFCTKVQQRAHEKSEHSGNTKRRKRS